MSARRHGGPAAGPESITALGRIGGPEDAADAVGLPAGPRGRWTTGDLLVAFARYEEELREYAEGCRRMGDGVARRTAENITLRTYGQDG
ncbi:hypothetical protein [Streptomyces globisporus]|uniref:hypothetical protein n=1 Tax=Streptomyces globisporus TaxID=1908 RepID=UPI0004C94444|nr:hypothetical protein [Streptomyces globisporus]